MTDNPSSQLPFRIDIKADATKSLQDISGTIRDAATFVGTVLGAPIESIGGILSDQVQYWRACNIERLKSKWLARRKEKGVSAEAIKYLPFHIGIRLIEAASQEDDEDVQALWAALLDTATDPDGQKTVKRIHIDILKSISGIEARILRFLALRISLRDLNRDYFDNLETAKFVENSLQQFTLSARRTAIQNLKRQECVRLIPDRYHLETIDEISEVLRPNVDVSKDDFIRIIKSIKSLAEDAAGVRDAFYLGDSSSGSGVPEMAFELTELGRSLMSVCGILEKEIGGSIGE